MKGTNDVQILLSIIIFLVTLAFVTVQFGTEVVRTQTGFNGSYAEGNVSVVGEDTSIIPAPPVCTSITGNSIPFIGGLIDAAGCMVGYIIWFGGLMFITSDTQWFYILIIFPCIAAIGFILVRLLKPTGGSG